MIEEPTIPDGELLAACRTQAAQAYILLNVAASAIEGYNLVGIPVGRDDALTAYALLLQTVAFNRLVEILENGLGVATDPGEHSYTSRLVTRAVNAALRTQADSDKPDATTSSDDDPGFADL